MLDLERIEDEIRLYEHRGKTDYDTCERLAVLYAVRDHHTPKQAGQYSREAAPVSMPEKISVGVPTSDFLRSVQGKDPEKAWAIMDELMATMRAVNTRVYDRVMERLSGL